MIYMVINEAHRLKSILLCPPGPEYGRVENLEEHHFAGKPDLERARKQHGEIRAVMEHFGAGVTGVEELAGHPNSVFTRDVALVAGSGFVQLRMGLESRRGEEAWMAGILEEIGIPRVAGIDPPGTVEGGDVILAGRVAFVGHSSRSNRAGVEQLMGVLKRMGFEVRVQEISDQFLHIGGAMSLVGPELVLCGSGVFPDGFFQGYQVIEVPDDSFSSVNVICLGEGEVILHSGFSKTIECLGGAGLKVHALDLSEILKGGGGPTCVTLPLERGV